MEVRPGRILSLRDDDTWPCGSMSMTKRERLLGPCTCEVDGRGRLTDASFWAATAMTMARRFANGDFIAVGLQLADAGR